MERFENLAVFLPEGPGNDAALDRALRVSRQNGARLKVIDVVPEVPGYLSALLSSGRDHEREARRARREKLEALLGSFDSAGVELRVKVLTGPPALELTREVIRGDHDLLLKTARHPGDEDPSLGTVAHRLVRICPCPLWVVAKQANARTVLAAVDVTSERAASRGLNRRILRLASSLAQFEDAALEVLHVFDPTKMLIAAHHADRGHLQSLEQRAWRETRHRLEVALKEAEVDLEEEARHLMAGRPREAIVEYARANNTDLVVMGSVGRTGVAGFLIGNTAEAVLRRLPCSVLAVKPEGYVSPVTLDD